MHNAINEIRELLASVEKFAAFAGKIDVSRYPFEKIGSFTKDRDEARFTLLSINRGHISNPAQALAILFRIRLYLENEWNFNDAITEKDWMQALNTSWIAEYTLDHQITVVEVFPTQFLDFTISQITLINRRAHEKKRPMVFPLGVIRQVREELAGAKVIEIVDASLEREVFGWSEQSFFLCVFAVGYDLLY